MFDEPVRPDRLETYLANTANWLFVALKDGEVVGQCAAVVHTHPDKPTELFLDEIGVTPNLRRKGIARNLMKALFALADEAGIEECWVGTEEANAPARALYETMSGPAERFMLYYLDW